jgi:hypothetical protein
MDDATLAPPAARWVAVGRSLASSGRRAAAEAATAALAGGEEASLLIVFSSAQYDTDEVLTGIRAVTPGSVRVVGGTAMGEIATPGEGFEDLGIAPAVVVMALGGSGFEIATTVVRRASSARWDAGVAAAEVMDQLTSPHQVMLMIADGLTREQHELVRGAYSVLGAPVPIVGGCSADNLEYLHTSQFHGTGASIERLDDSIVAIGLGSNAPIGVGLSHGWVKHGEPMVVTSSIGGEVLTLDDEPAIDVYLRRIGAERSLLDDPAKFREVAFQHPLGMSRRSGEDIRVVHEADAERGSLLCLSDVPQGGLVWTMTTDSAALIAAAGASCETAVQGLGGDEPLGMLVFDCGARKMRLDPEELRAEQATIGAASRGAPFAGFYTFGEIGRTSGARGMHHLTVVTLALA